MRTVPEPTMEIDWDRVHRYTEREGSVRGHGLGKYGGTDLPGQLEQEGTRLQLERLRSQTACGALKD